MRRTRNWLNSRWGDSCRILKLLCSAGLYKRAIGCQRQHDLNLNARYFYACRYTAITEIFIDERKIQNAVNAVFVFLWVNTSVTFIPTVEVIIRR